MNNKSKSVEFKSQHAHLTSIEYTSDSILLKSRDGNDLLFTEKDKPQFKTNTGETVIEFSGMATDNNEEKSWVIAYFKPNGYSPKHYHTKRTEFYYIISGTARLVLDGQEYHLSAGDTMTIKPNQRHQVFNTSHDDMLVLIDECIPAWVADDHIIDNETNQ